MYFLLYYLLHYVFVHFTSNFFVYQIEFFSPSIVSHIMHSNIEIHQFYVKYRTTMSLRVCMKSATIVQTDGQIAKNRPLYTGSDIINYIKKTYFLAHKQCINQINYFKTSEKLKLIS